VHRQTKTGVISKKNTFNMLFSLLVISIIIGFSLSSVLSASELPKPKIPKPLNMVKGDTCVADPHFMRLNHMDMLKHDRDKTVHEGQRDIQYSLKECVACHAVNDEQGNAVTVAEPEHFCRSCHDYAAVTIDCFQCHASRPEMKEEKQIKAMPDGHQEMIEKQNSKTKDISSEKVEKSP
jgi:hypothetical protein